MRIDNFSFYSDESQSSRQRIFPAKDKILLHSSIHLENSLYQAFKTAAETNGYAGDGTFSPGVQPGVVKKSEGNNSDKYDRTDIAARHRSEKSNSRVIAFSGGNVCPDSIPGGDFDPSPTTTYLALVGTSNHLDSNIVGGVNLQSTAHLPTRRNTIINRPGGAYTMNNVYLYRNLNSDYKIEEENMWAAPTMIDSAAGHPYGDNDPNGFHSDFVNGGPCDVALGIVISDDPFFRSKRASLMQEVTAWLLRNQNRYVLYPSQIYGPLAPNPPYPAQGDLSGPSLVAAYTQLGNLARDAYNGRQVSWILL